MAWARETDRCRTQQVVAPAQTAGRSLMPCGTSPVVASRHNAISSLRASATIIVLRMSLRPLAVCARYHCARALSGWNLRNPPGQLDHAVPDPGIAGAGQPFLAPLLAAFVRGAGQPGVTRHRPAVAHRARAHLDG